MHLNISLSFSAVVIACLVVANGDGNINKESGNEKTEHVDDAIPPKIQIKVRTFPSGSEINTRQKIEQKMILEESALKSIGKVDTSGFDFHNEKEPVNTESNDEGFKSDSFLTTSVRDISSIANLVWSYVTDSQETTEIPDKLYDLKTFDKTKKVETESTDKTLDSPSEDEDTPLTHITHYDQLSPDERNESIYQTNETGNNVYTSEINFNEITIGDKSNKEATRSHRRKGNAQLREYKSRKQMKKIDKQDKRNELPVTSSSNSEEITKEMKSSERVKADQSDNQIVGVSSERVKADQTDNQIVGVSSEKEGLDSFDDEADAGEALQGDRAYNDDVWDWRKLSWFARGSDTKVGTTPGNLTGVPAEIELIVDIGSASAVDALNESYERLTQETVHQPHLYHYSQTPIIEADLSTSDIASLVKRYETCDSCMVDVRNTTQQCTQYGDQASEFDQWARTFSDLLRHGCSGLGVQHKRCCHAPVAREAVRQVQKVVKSITGVLLRQCEKCPVDCVWAEWSEWSSCCPVKCGDTGTTIRTRERVEEKYSGIPCSGDREQRKRCPAPITERGSWLEWSSWSACSNTCGGTKHRTRTCSPKTHSCSCFDDCQGDSLEVDNCRDNQKCCHHRQWGDWGPWFGECPAAGDHRSTPGQRIRWQACESDASHKNEPICPESCQGQRNETKACCVEAYWGEWTSWTECIGTDNVIDLETGRQCGKGCKSRERVCHNGTCENSTCYGDHIERLLCNLDPCCAPPVWTPWCQWSACSSTSGSGVRRRSRSCQSDPDQWRRPVCRAGGCYGQRDTDEAEVCRGVCSVCDEPVWGHWESWSDCDFSQRQPKRISRRRCRNPSAWDPNCQHRHCQGNDAVREEDCVCARPSWTTWTEWGACDRTRRPPQKKRSRWCQPVTNPTYCPEVSCPGDSEIVENCCGPQQWLLWGQWSQCDYRTAQPRRTRTRICSAPDAGCPDRRCEGSSLEHLDCDIPSTSPPVSCDSGQWGPWSPWSRCDCDVSRMKSRTRNKTYRYGSSTHTSLCLPTRQLDSQPCEDCNEFQETCAGREDGKYPSFKQGCRSFVTCCQGVPQPDECKGGQQYDSECQKCRKPPSPTCHSGQYDIHRDRLVFPPPRAECKTVQG